MATSPRNVLFRTLLVAGVAVPTLSAASLRPEALDGWTTYVAVTEARIAREMRAATSAPGRFLAQDFLPSAAQLRGDVLSGTIVMDEMHTTGLNGNDIAVPSARVHHWRGAVFIPGARLDTLLASLQAEVPPQEDVVRSAVLERGPDRMRVYLRLRRTKIVTAVYDSEHLVSFSRLGPARASSTSRSTRIAEVERPGTAEERELAPGEDRGFLWRLNAYWRYEEVPGGVIAECESLSLSRDVPTLVRVVAGPLINGVARESMARTLTSLRYHLGEASARSTTIGTSLVAAITAPEGRR
jgi:hypothetical protein